MLNLIDENAGYLLVSPYQEKKTEEENYLALSKAQSLLYNREYSLLSITGYCGGAWDKSYLAYNHKDNDTLREDALFILERTNQNEIIVKYRGTDKLTLISKDGAESPLSLQNYSEHSESTKVFIYNGWYFSLKPEIRYFMIESKNQLKKGMKLEYFNNEKWNEKVVHDVDSEFENMYKLLIKYNKLRSIAY